MKGNTLKLGRPDAAAQIDERYAREPDGWRKRRLLAVKLAALELQAGSRVKVWFMDEARFGLHPELRRVWTRRGLRPVVTRQIRYERDYLYGALGAVRESMRAMARLWTRINAIAPAPPGVALPLVLLGKLHPRAAERRLGEPARGLPGADRCRCGSAIGLGQSQRYAGRHLPGAKGLPAEGADGAPGGNALRDTLPTLSPPEGHTPEPVAVTGVWQASTTQAKVTWEASEDAELREYQMRGVPGNDYVTEDEVTLATVLPGAPLELLTNFALGSPGAIAGFKVYVVLTTGRERGSEPVFVTRPA